ncbi:MAG: hypothetical protein IPP36_01055 [Nitrosomonadales bacterium]|nr:hypothetical protein [Nitrosomonadales bacterium]
MPYEISLVEARVAAGECPGVATLGCCTLLKEKIAVGAGGGAVTVAVAWALFMVEAAERQLTSQR